MHWYDGLRALGIRERGICCAKDTFVTRMLQTGGKIAWLEAQTGVSYATLRWHYGQWMPSEGDGELHRLEALDRVCLGLTRQIVPHINGLWGTI